MLSDNIQRTERYYAKNCRRSKKRNTDIQSARIGGVKHGTHDYEKNEWH